MPGKLEINVSVAGHMESNISGYLGWCYVKHNGGSIAIALRVDIKEFFLIVLL